MLLMSLKIRIDFGQASIQFDPEFRKLTGITDKKFSVNDILQDINLESFRIRAEQDAEFGGPTIAIGVDLEERGDEIDLGLLLGGGNLDDLSFQIVFYLDLFAASLNDFFATALVRRNGENIPRPISIVARVYAHPDLVGIWVNILSWVKDKFGGQFFAETIEDARSKLEIGLNELIRTRSVCTSRKPSYTLLKRIMLSTLCGVTKTP